jgi:hypothetical protein
VLLCNVKQMIYDHFIFSVYKMIINHLLHITIQWSIEYIPELAEYFFLN